MDWIYVIISAVLSLSLAAIISVPVSRAKKYSQIFSAALGIIIFRCVKSIFAECGWGFAAIFGVFNGIAAQAVIFAAAFVFFHELSTDEILSRYVFGLPQIFYLIIFGVGKNLLCDYSALSDVMLYVLGEAADFAIILLSVHTAVNCTNSEVFPRKNASVFMNRALIVTVLKAAAIIIYRSFEYDEGNSFAPLVMITIGISGMVCDFARAVNGGIEISAAGFSAGLTVGFCFDSLMG